MARYVTFFYAQLNAETRAFRFVNAGHSPPLLFHGSTSESSKKGCVDRLSAGGPVLGMFPGLQFDEGSVDVKSGDILLAYTDGVTEAPNIHGEEFSEDRVIEVLRRCSGESQEILWTRSRQRSMAGAKVQRSTMTSPLLPRKCVSRSGSGVEPEDTYACS